MIQTRVAGRYVLLSPLGAGGEARVFRARDEQDGTEIALRLAIGAVNAVISSPPAISSMHWVRFIDSGIDPQHGAYQAFELLEGQTLAVAVAAGRLDAPAWRTLVEQSLEAVEKIHLAEWVHGDLNADNLLSTGAGWKLLELPFYRFDGAPRSTMFGSIFTLAPEQIDGASASVRSDLYSLGCLYYYAAGAAWPHDGASTQQIAIDRLTRVPTHLRDIAPQLPAAASDWVMKLLEREPESRFPSVATARHVLADAVA